MAEDLSELLERLAGHARQLNDTHDLEEFQRQACEVAGACDLTLQHLATARGALKATTPATWESLADSGVVLADVVKTLNAAMRFGKGLQPCIAAVLYSWLLRAPGSPAHSILDGLTFSGFMQRVKDACCPRAPVRLALPGEAPEGDDGADAAGPSDKAADAAADDVAACLAYEAVSNLAATLSSIGLRSLGDVMQLCCEALPELAASARIAAKATAATRGAGLTPGDTRAAAYEAMGALLNVRHGPLHETAAALFPRLSPVILGAAAPASGRKGAADANASRTAACTFVCDALGRNPEVQEAVAALARHVCLRAPDRAEPRANAIRAAAAMAPLLAQWEQEQFVGFVFHLSRSTKIGHRCLAVGLARELLMHLPEPFKQSTFEAAAAAAAPTAPDGCPATPPPLVPAPWSVVCLAAMLHRCSDKAAAVRAKALSDLSEVVACFGELLARDPASDEYRVAERFVAGLAAAAQLQLPKPSGAPKAAGAKPAAAKKRRDRGAEEEDAGAASDGEGGPGAPADGMEVDWEDAPAADGEATAAGGSSAGAAAAAVPPSAGAAAVAFEALIPRRLQSDLGLLMALVHRRCADPKAAVRRGALQLLVEAVTMRAGWQGYPRQLPSEQDLALLEAATLDPLVSVRKAALIALSRLVELLPLEPALSTAWVRSALPLVRDPESGIQESVLEWAQFLLLDRAAAVAGPAPRRGASRATAAAMDVDGENAGAEGGEDEEEEEEETPAAVAAAELRPVLAAVSAVGRAAGACLSKVCAALGVKRKLAGRKVAAGIEAFVAGVPSGSPEALGAWMLLKEVAGQDPGAPSWQFLQARWAALQSAAAAAHRGDNQGAEDAGGSLALAEEGALLLLVISAAADSFPPAQATALASSLLEAILTFNLPPAAAAAHIAALYKLTSGGDAAGVGTPAEWCRKAYTAAHSLLHQYVSGSFGGAAGAAADPQFAARLQRRAAAAIFAVGELALLRAAKPPGGLAVLLQALTAPKLLPGMVAAAAGLDPDSDAAGGAEGAAAGDGDATNAAGASPEGVDGEEEEAEEGAAAGARQVPAALQGHAWIALGKVCLVDEALAKRLVPLFVQELGRSPSPVVRNNIMVALSDMVITYTALVDAHTPRLAACIRDRHELVRRQALALLANLLMKDYVKWRGTLFHRFLLALVDPSPGVRQLAEFLLTDTLATKAPLLAYNHFVESLFVLNGCAVGLYAARVSASLAGAPDGGAAAGAAAAGDAPAQFTLRGAANRPQRDLIYRALLKHMSTEHKFSTSAKLASEVLAGVADGLLPLEEASEVLRDALTVMASKEIKVSASRLAADDDAEEMRPGATGGPPATGAEAAARARGRLVSAMMKRHLVESVVPVMVELRRLLAEARSPLMGDLMGCFSALLKEYKGEVEEILVADKQLAREILYDMKQAEAEKQQAAAAAAAAAKTPGGLASDAAAALAGVRLGGAGKAGGAEGQLPAGVLPGTPIAAEVLATAERGHRERRAAAAAGGAAAGTPARGVAPGDAAAAGTPPATAGPPRTPYTAARSRLSLPPATGGKAAAGLRTPGALAATPAPLSARRARVKSENAPPGDDADCAAAAAAGGTTPGGTATGVEPPSVARRRSVLLQKVPSPAEAPTVVHLPSPFRDAPQRQWQIDPAVAEGAKGTRRGGGRTTRGRKAAAGVTGMGDAGDADEVAVMAAAVAEVADAEDAGGDEEEEWEAAPRARAGGRRATRRGAADAAAAPAAVAVGKRKGRG